MIAELRTSGSSNHQKPRKLPTIVSMADLSMPFSGFEKPDFLVFGGPNLTRAYLSFNHLEQSTVDPCTWTSMQGYRELGRANSSGVSR